MVAREGFQRKWLSLPSRTPWNCDGRTIRTGTPLRTGAERLPPGPAAEGGAGVKAATHCRRCQTPLDPDRPVSGIYAGLCRACRGPVGSRRSLSRRREGGRAVPTLPPGWQACLGCEIGVEAPRTVCGACEAEARGERIQAAPQPTRHGDGGIPVIWEARRKTRRTPDELQIAGHGSGG